jgi:hypothetical protein
MFMLKDYGPFFGLVIFFIWRQTQREKDFAERIKQLEDFNTDILAGLVKETTAIIAANTEQLRLNNLLTEIKAQQNG